MDAARYIKAVREAREIVDQALPWQANMASQDLTELRKVALETVLRELLSEESTFGAPRPSL